ncbi:MAG: aminopeptidase P family protein [Oscillochloris sp.]|nr:aminopeptidase P family protein [Oscillochloris sp.]
MNIYQEKAAQAVALLQELDLDCWLTFARETGERPDPGVEMLLGSSLTWNAVLLIGRNGERSAIVGRYDLENARASGVFTEVIGYDEDLRADLLAALDRINPRSISLNYSLHDHTADGLTHGMYLLLQETLAGTAYQQRLVSGEGLLAKLRARKTPGEIERIKAAIAVTETIVGDLSAQITPGRSEAELAAWVHNEFARRGLPSAWDYEYCPTLNSGPESAAGHAPPLAHIKVEPGHLVHIDLGVKHEGYCSDLQRMWYVRRAGEDKLPDEIQRAWAAIVAAIDAGAAALRPGVAGWQVDAAARNVLTSAGYDEYKHALGHGLGRACHDGGPLLGPRWPRYGNSPLGIVEAGHVYTLELDVMTSAGMLALEEDVLVTEDGCVFLSNYQREIFLI